PRQNARQTRPHRRRPGSRRRRIPRPQEKNPEGRFLPRQAGQRLRETRRRRSLPSSLPTRILRSGRPRSHGLRSSRHRHQRRRRPRSRPAWRGWIFGGTRRCEGSRALRHRNSLSRRPRPRNGQNRPHQRQEKLLRQRRHPRLRELLQAHPRRILSFWFSRNSESFRSSSSHWTLGQRGTEVLLLRSPPLNNVEKRPSKTNDLGRLARKQTKTDS